MSGLNENDLIIEFITIKMHEMSEHSAIGLYMSTKEISIKV